jgi:hypothetical protein
MVERDAGETVGSEKLAPADVDAPVLWTRVGSRAVDEQHGRQPLIRRRPARPVDVERERSPAASREDDVLLDDGTVHPRYLEREVAADGWVAIVIAGGNTNQKSDHGECGEPRFHPLPPSWIVPILPLTIDASILRCH